VKAAFRFAGKTEGTDFPGLVDFFVSGGSRPRGSGRDFHATSWKKGDKGCPPGDKKKKTKQGVGPTGFRRGGVGQDRPAGPEGPRGAQIRPAFHGSKKRGAGGGALLFQGGGGGPPKKKSCAGGPGGGRGVFQKQTVKGGKHGPGGGRGNFSLLWETKGDVKKTPEGGPAVLRGLRGTRVLGKPPGRDSE